MINFNSTKLILLFLTLPFQLFGAQILCSGNSVEDESIKIKFVIDDESNKITAEDNVSYQLSVNNDFLYEWEAIVDNYIYINTIDKLTGEMLILSRRAGDQNLKNVAFLMCMNKEKAAIS